MAARLFCRFARSRGPASVPATGAGSPPAPAPATGAGSPPAPATGAGPAPAARTSTGSPPGPETSAKLGHRIRPQRPSETPGADDAELDALRGELVRELNRLAERSRGVD